MITKQAKIPANSLLKKESTFDYIDSFQCLVFTKNPNVDISTILMLFMHSGPKWADSLLAVRDKIVGVFGLKTSSQMLGNQIEQNYNIGEQVGLFKLFNKSEREFILGEDDKHLNFRVSLLFEPVDDKINERRLAISTAVKYNNLFGKIYFLPVKPIHRLIIRSTLKKIVKQIETQYWLNAKRDH